MNVTIKTDDERYGEAKISLCEHIEISAVEGNDRSEYTDMMGITCRICKTKHLVTIEVN